MSASLRKRPNCCDAAKCRDGPIASSALQQVDAYSITFGARQESHGHALPLDQDDVFTSMPHGRKSHHSRELAIVPFAKFAWYKLFSPNFLTSPFRVFQKIFISF